MDYLFDENGLNSKEEQLKLALNEVDLSDEEEVDLEFQQLTLKIKKVPANQPEKANVMRVRLEKLAKIKELFDDTNSGKQSSSNKTQQSSALEDLREDYLLIPKMCLERIVMELIYQLETNQSWENDSWECEAVQSQQLDFGKKLEELETALMKQDLFKDKLRFMIQDLNVLYTSKAGDLMNSISKLLRAIMLEIMPVSHFEIRRLLKKAESAAEQIKERDIVLFIGDSGSGKSTTIQFLSGCNMIQTRQEISPGKFLLHIEPDEKTRNLCSENIISNAESKSTTRYIAAQHVPLEVVNRSGFITLCDAPGFGDTAGAEVDVANSMGVFKALCGCKSVKIVAFASYRSIGDRGQGIVKLANILANMIDDVTNRLASIQYVFTKFPEDNRDVNAMLTNIRDVSSKDVALQTNEAFMSILNDMIYKTEQDTLFVDPIGGDRRKLIDRFLKIRGITSPKDVLRCSLETKSRDMLRTQAQLDKKNVQMTLRDNSVSLVGHYLSNLKSLGQLTQQGFVGDIYNEAKEYVKDVLNKQYQSALTNLNRALSSRDGFDAEDTGEYRRIIEQFDNMQAIIKNNFDKNEVISSETIIHNVVSKLQARSDELDKVELCDPRVSTHLANALLFRNTFEKEPEFSRVYDSVCQKLFIRYNQLAQQVHKTLEEDDHETNQTMNITGLAENLKVMSVSLHLLRRHLNEQIVNKLFNDTLKQLVEHYEKISKTCELILVNCQRLNSRDMQKIEIALKRLNSASDNLILQDLCQMKLKDVNTKLLNAIIVYFDVICVKANELFDKNSEMVIENVEKYMREMEFIHKMEEKSGFLFQRTSRDYYRITERVQEFMQLFKNELEKLFEKVDLTNEAKMFQNYSTIANRLSRITKNAEWIEDINSGAYNELIRFIEGRLFDRYEQMRQQQDAVNHIDNPEKVLTLKPCIAEMRAMYTLEKCLPSLQEQRQSVEKLFGAHIAKAITQIENDLNQKNINGSDNILTLDAEKYEKELIYLTNVKQISFANIESSIIGIFNKLFKHIEAYGLRLNEEIKQHFEHVTKHFDETTIFESSQNLTLCLNQLTYLRERAPSLYNCINGTQRTSQLRSTFTAYFNQSKRILEEKITTDSSEANRQLTIVDALSIVDKFCQTERSEGFSMLYEKHKSLLTLLGRTTLASIIDSIHKFDFEQASLDIGTFKFDPKDVKQITNDLNKSIKKLQSEIQFNLSSPFKNVDTTDKLADISAFREKLDKIMLIIDTPNLAKFVEEINLKNLKILVKNFHNKCLNFVQENLTSVDEYVKSDCFFQADQLMENINHVIDVLMREKCLPDDVAKHYQEITKKLEKIPNEILKRDFADINSYSQNPPKNLIGKIDQMVSRGQQRYIQLKTIVLDKIRQKFENQIDHIYALPAGDRQVLQKKLANIFRNCVPIELELTLKEKLDELEANIQKSLDEYKEQVEEIISLTGDSETDMSRIEECFYIIKNQHLNSIFDGLKIKIQNKLNVMSSELKICMKTEKDMKSGLNILKKTSLFYVHLKNFIPQIESTYKYMCNEVVQALKNDCNELLNLKLASDSSKIEKAYLFINDFVSCASDNFKSISNKYDLQLDGSLNAVCEFFLQNSHQFTHALNNREIAQIKGTLGISRTWRKLFDLVKESVDNLEMNKLKGVLEYSVMLDQLNEILEDSQNIILEEKQPHEINSLATSQTNLSEYFEKLKVSLNFLELVSKKMKDELKQMHKEEIFNECKNSLKSNSENIVKKLKHCCDSLHTYSLVNSTKEHLCREFSKYYNYLEAANKAFTWLKLTSFLEAARFSIFKIIDNIRSEIDLNALNTQSIADPLMEMKFFAINIIMFSDDINRIIVDILTAFKKKRRFLIQLCILFEKEEIGLRMIDEFPILRSEHDGINSEKIRSQNNIEYGLDNIKGEYLSLDYLRTSFECFENKYKNNLIMFITDLTKKKENIQIIVYNCRKIVSGLTKSTKKWTLQIRDSIPEIIANLFTIWTLIIIQDFYETTSAGDLCLLKPHVGQILAIYRMLGIGYDKSIREVIKTTETRDLNSNMFRASDNEFNADKHLYNNLIQVGAGEGKSVIVAIVACVLALFGADVSCTCYSDYSISRDKQNFSELFAALGIKDHIHYGTFNQLCELMLNDKCNLREKVKAMISENKRDLSGINIQNPNNPLQRPKVLIVDEVDVFLSDQFYGGTYQPSCWIKSDVIVSLFDQIWTENKALPSFTVYSISRMSTFRECAAKYSNHVYILEEAIKDMITTLKSYDKGTYFVKDDKIAYVDGENITSNVAFGYNTVWQYYLEHEKGNISRESLVNNVGILVKFGRFSYAELPLNFAFISGVSGTLSSLSSKEKTILSETYKIHVKTNIPSIFDKSKRLFDPKYDLRVYDDDNYFSSIRHEIENILSVKRSILIFFKSNKHLNDFYNSSELASIQDQVQVLIETDDPSEKQIKVNRSTEIEKVTLVTRAMGRGTNFVCRSWQLIANGGIHVLQTFFSEEESEEIQIKSRTARQGQPGSYRMILLDTELEWLLGAKPKEELAKAKEYQLYKFLKELRSSIYECKSNFRELNANRCRDIHKISVKFLNAMKDNDMSFVISFLKEKNRGSSAKVNSSRTIVLMSANGSMYTRLSSVKETVIAMFQRVSQIIDSFAMQLVFYSNYNCKSDMLLQSSPWETKAENVRKFMQNIEVTGGIGDEAIEIGLWHAVRESEKREGVSQVILIGGMPAQSNDAVINNRRRFFGEEYWSKSRFGKPTHYLEQLQILAGKKIPVHAFYLTDAAKENFVQIAYMSGGRCEKLTTNATHGAETLTNLVTEETLGISGSNKRYSKYISLSDIQHTKSC